MPNGASDVGRDVDKGGEAVQQKESEDGGDVTAIPYLALNVGQVSSCLTRPNPPEPKRHSTIISLLDHRAEHAYNHVAVGFPDCDGGSCLEWTYHDLYTVSVRLASRIGKRIEHDTELRDRTAQPVVALLAPSGPAFLAHVLACWRLGLAILPIALGTTSSGAASLMASTGARWILNDPSQDTQVEQIRHAYGDGSIQPLGWCDLEKGEDEVDGIECPVFTQSENDCLVIFHSSGSSGNPKPIKHLHRFWTTSLLAAFGANRAAFTTTPLFHGGLSDLLRAFQAGAPLYLYAWHQSRAVTTASILASLQACSRPIHYFLSVPFILETLFHERSGRQMLQAMDMVSTGGAPLSQAIGDMMVHQNHIKLVSRLGSSECGFLMSSWRDFDADNDWAWLRIFDNASSQWLSFEPQQDGQLFELVVSGKWPSKLLSNRPDGSYATGDLYYRHPQHEDRWRYGRRADDSIVMVNGKKVASAPMEEALRSLDGIEDVIVFGANRPLLGALVQRSKGSSSADVRSTLEHKLSGINKSLPSHARLAQEMIMIADDDDVFASLPRSSKGTLQRGLALDQLASLIDGVYTRFDQGEVDIGRPRQRIRGKALLEWLQRTLSNISDQEIGPDDDLYAAGVDSIMATRLRTSIHQGVELDGFLLSSNAIYEYPTLRKLENHIDMHEIQGGNAAQYSVEKVAGSLIEQYSQFAFTTAYHRIHSDNDCATVLLTGATGTLGSRILHGLLLDNSVEHIVCHVRADDVAKAKHRIAASLQNRCLESDPGLISRKVSYVTSFTDDHLSTLRDSSKAIIIHCAWTVNFALHLASFESHCISSLASLLQLFSHCNNPDQFIFCSSLASIQHSSAPQIERHSDDVHDAGMTGYAQSKWVAEQICRKAADAAKSTSTRITIARVGQLCGDTQSGTWNETEAWPLLVRTANEVGVLPNEGPDIDWLPVDCAANAILQIGLSRVNLETQTIVHIALPPSTPRPSWCDFIDWLQTSKLAPFESVSKATWLAKVCAAGGQVRGRALLAIWERMPIERGPATVHTTRAEHLALALGKAKTMDRTLCHRIVERWLASGFVH